MSPSSLFHSLLRSIRRPCPPLGSLIRAMSSVTSEEAVAESLSLALLILVMMKRRSLRLRLTLKEGTVPTTLTVANVSNATLTAVVEAWCDDRPSMCRVRTACTVRPRARQECTPTPQRCSLVSRAHRPVWTKAPREDAPTHAYLSSNSCEAHRLLMRCQCQHYHRRACLG